MKKRYSIYNSNGQFTTWATVPDVDGFPAPENSVEGVFGDGWYFDFGAGEAAQKPLRPSPHHVFNYTAKQWEDLRTADTEWPLVRARRNDLLTACDWTQLPDVPLATKEAWAAYRQALRDITEQPDPFSIVWPTPPA